MFDGFVKNYEYQTTQKCLSKKVLIIVDCLSTTRASVIS